MRGERQRQPIQVVVNELELARALERVGARAGLADAPVDASLFRVARRRNAVQLRARERVERREQRDVDAARHQPFGEQARHLLPGP
jgi:hypothetical protein